MHIHYIQHVPFEGPASIGQWHKPQFGDIDLALVEHPVQGRQRRGRVQRHAGLGTQPLDHLNGPVQVHAGLGMDGHEWPYLVENNMFGWTKTVVLKPGMTFTNEPGIYIYGEFGSRIEDCLVVTDSGAWHLGGLEAESIDRPFGSA